MSIDDLIAKKSVKQVVSSLSELEKDLHGLIKPIKGVLNPSEKRKDELFDRVKSLREETEELLKQASKGKESRDVKVIRSIMDRVKKIIEEKERIKEELKILNITK